MLAPLGYPELATFLDSDENFMVYRRFGLLHARLLLRKQDELRVLEERLDDMDQEESIGMNLIPMAGSQQRKDLLASIEHTFSEYSK